MNEKIDLSIIIVNFNTKDLLRDCLNSIRRSETNYSLEIIIADNKSQDGSSLMVKKEFKEVVLLENKDNLGFSKANNQGIKKAHGRYILLLNPDTIVPKDTLQVMFDFMEKNQKVGAATCKIELADGSLDQACHRGFPTVWNSFTYFTGLEKLFPKIKLFSGYSLSHLFKNTTHEIDSACGAFLIIRREAGEEVDWLDEDYFWYGEDLDFCYRLKQKGWQIMFVPQVKIIHYKGAASGIKKHSQKISTADGKIKEKAIRASTEVMRIFFKKHYQNKYPKFIYKITMLGVKFLEKIRLLKLN